MHYGKKEAIIVLIVCGILILAGLLALICSNTPDKQDFSDYYDLKEIKASVVMISGEINVRSEPLVTKQYYTAYAGTSAGAAGYGIETIGVNTSYGKVKADDLCLTVANLYYPINCHWDDCCQDGGDAFNGPFVGIAVKDITAVDNWKKYFPNDIKNDPDGIVWVSTKGGVVKYGAAVL